MITNDLHFRGGPQGVVQDNHGANVREDVRLKETLPRRRVAPSLNNEGRDKGSRVRTAGKNIRVIILCNVGTDDERCAHVLLDNAGASASLIVKCTLCVAFGRRLINGIINVHVPFMGGRHVALARVKRGPLLPKDGRLLHSRKRVQFVHVYHVVLAGDRVMRGFAHLAFLDRYKGPRNNDTDASFVVRVSEFKNVRFLNCGIVRHVGVTLFRQQGQASTLHCNVSKKMGRTFPWNVIRATLIRNIQVSIFRTLYHVLQTIPWLSTVFVNCGPIARVRRATRRYPQEAYQVGRQVANVRRMNLCASVIRSREVLRRDLVRRRLCLVIFFELRLVASKVLIHLAKLRFGRQNRVPLRMIRAPLRARYFASMEEFRRNVDPVRLVTKYARYFYRYPISVIRVTLTVKGRFNFLLPITRINAYYRLSKVEARNLLRTYRVVKYLLNVGPFIRGRIDGVARRWQANVI